MAKKVVKLWTSVGSFPPNSNTLEIMWSPRDENTKTPAEDGIGSAQKVTVLRRNQRFEKIAGGGGQDRWLKGAWGDRDRENRLGVVAVPLDYYWFSVSLWVHQLFLTISCISPSPLNTPTPPTRKRTHTKFRHQPHPSSSCSSPSLPATHLFPYLLACLVPALSGSIHISMISNSPPLYN